MREDDEKLEAILEEQRRMQRLQERIRGDKARNTANDLTEEKRSAGKSVKQKVARVL